MPCHPSHALQDKLREDEEYLGVRCEVVDGEVVTLVARPSSIDASAFQAPLFVGYLSTNQSIPNGSGYTIVTPGTEDPPRGACSTTPPSTPWWLRFPERRKSKYRRVLR